MTKNSVLIFVLFFSLITLPSIAPATDKDDSNIAVLWQSDKARAAVGSVIVQILAADDSRCTDKKLTDSQSMECYRKIYRPLTASVDAIIKSKEDWSDVALVQLLGFSIGNFTEGISSEIIKRGKKMVPILDFAFKTPVCDKKEDICRGTKELHDAIVDLKKNCLTGTNPWE